MIVYIYIYGPKSGVIRTWLEVAEDYPSAVLRTDTPEGETDTETERDKDRARDAYEEHILGKATSAESDHNYECNH